MKSLIKKVRKKIGVNFHRKPIEILPSFKAVSFTFDDAPISAFETAGAILKNYNLQATYYIALSFLEKPEADQYFDIKTLAACLSEGHELACHTYEHLHFYDNSHSQALKDIENNLSELKKHFPSEKFRNFSYPFGEQTKSAREITKSKFRSARGIENGINLGRCDLNSLKTIPLYEDRFSISEQIERITHHQASGGWLIFYTHDVQSNYSTYGCSPEYLEKVIQACVNTGVDVMTVNGTLDKLQA